MDLMFRLRYGWYLFVIAPAEWWARFWSWACGVEFEIEEHDDDLHQ